MSLFAFKAVVIGYVLLLIIALYALIMPARFQPRPIYYYASVGFAFGLFIGSLWLLIVR